MKVFWPMTLRPVTWLILIGLFVLSFLLSPSLSVTTVYAQLVSPALLQRAENQGEVRVIVRLAVSDAPPETWIDSDILRGIRRADISHYRDVVRSSLLNVPHRVHRELMISLSSLSRWEPTAFEPSNR